MERTNKSSQDMKDSAKLRLLSSITADQEVIGNADHVAMNQEELQDLLVNPPETIYLVGGPFSIPSAHKNIRYVGVNQPEVTLEKGKLIADYSAIGITFKDVRYTSPYCRTEAEQLYLTDKYAEALPLLEDDANQGNPRAMYMAAMCYLHGYGTSIDLKKCREWLQRSFGMREPLSSINYAFHCCKNNREQYLQILSEYFDDLQALALSGDYLAQFEFYDYVLNFRDKYTSQDCATAIEWYRQAAKQGHAWAQSKLGFMYKRGHGVEQDYEKAFEWYHKAAKQGFAEAQNNLGFMYALGDGVEQDDEKAVEWYRKAAEQGHAPAQYDLGFMYANGIGVEQDDAQAVEWYRKAAEQGHTKAQYSLAVAYANGDGVEQDDEKAVEWHRKATKQGYAETQCNLGVAYALGDGVNGVKEDSAQAVKWFRKAAEQGYARAQCYLGAAYELGQGVEQDYAQAVKWYRKAAEQGHKSAQKYLRRLGY